MDFVIDLDPAHSVIRLTITAAVVDLEIATYSYTRLKRITSRGGPYAGIYDLSLVTGTTLTVDEIKEFARREPSIPMGRPHVVVGKEPHILGFARIFQMCRQFRKGEIFDVVDALQEAYRLVGARPEDFTQLNDFFRFQVEKEENLDNVYLVVEERFWK